MDNSEFEENIPTWINHFENQAKVGISRRSSFNNKIIVVHDKKKIKNNDNSKVKEKIPDIVSPVQQVIEQAEEDLRREEKEEEEEKDTVHSKYKEKKATLKRKRTIKGKLSAKKFKDIFSKNK
jgi:hypothetical protein